MLTSDQDFLSMRTFLVVMAKLLEGKGFQLETVAMASTRHDCGCNLKTSDRGCISGLIVQKQGLVLSTKVCPPVSNCDENNCSRGTETLLTS